MFSSLFLAVLLVLKREPRKGMLGMDLRSVVVVVVVVVRGVGGGGGGWRKRRRWMVVRKEGFLTTRWVVVVDDDDERRDVAVMFVRVKVRMRVGRVGKRM